MIPLYSLAKQSKVMVSSPDFTGNLSGNKSSLEGTDAGLEATDFSLGTVSSQPKSRDGESICIERERVAEERVIGTAPQGNSLPADATPPP